MLSNTHAKLNEYGFHLCKVGVWRYFKLFQIFRFQKDLRNGLSAVGKTYAVSALQRNALTCLYGNNTARFFNVQPPALENYFRQMLQSIFAESKQKKLCLKATYAVFFKNCKIYQSWILLDAHDKSNCNS